MLKRNNLEAKKGTTFTRLNLKSWFKTHIKSLYDMPKHFTEMQTCYENPLNQLWVSSLMKLLKVRWLDHHHLTHSVVNSDSNLTPINLGVWSKREVVSNIKVASSNNNNKISRSNLKNKCKTQNLKQKIKREEKRDQELFILIQQWLWRRDLSLLHFEWIPYKEMQKGYKKLDSTSSPRTNLISTYFSIFSHEQKTQWFHSLKEFYKCFPTQENLTPKILNSKVTSFDSLSFYLRYPQIVSWCLPSVSRYFKWLAPNSRTKIMPQTSNLMPRFHIIIQSSILSQISTHSIIKSTHTTRRVQRMIQAINLIDKHIMTIIIQDTLAKTSKPSFNERISLYS